MPKGKASASISKAAKGATNSVKSLGKTALNSAKSVGKTAIDTTQAVGKLALNTTGSILKLGKNTATGTVDALMNPVDTLKKAGDETIKTTKRISATVRDHIIQSVLILFLIVYSSVIIKYTSDNFLRFFENMIVKIVVLVIIALVGIYSPGVALFLAIALIVTLQTAQKRKVLVDMNITEKFASDNSMDMVDMNTTPTEEHHSEEEHEEEHESFSNHVSNSPVGYNTCDSSCIDSKEKDSSLSGPCSSVQTFNNQLGPQGLQHPQGYDGCENAQF